ncbi:MAG: hypothetical protein QOE05_2531, partial [Actinomycetota bacterium]|nr:hypothetical protein [Actinomycetota bacterium]
SAMPSDVTVEVMELMSRSVLGG